MQIETRYKGGMTARSFSEVKKILHLKDEDLRGKSILDIGSGWGNFVRGVKKKYADDTRVVALDPRYHQNPLSIDLDVQQVPPRVKDMQKEGIEVVAGVAENLPFQDNMFDQVFSTYAVSYYLMGDELKSALREMIRVTKTNGTVRLHPVPDILSENIESDRIFLNFIQEAENHFREVNFYRLEKQTLILRDKRPNILES